MSALRSGIKLVTFDATNTLFKVSPSVGYHYKRVADKYKMVTGLDVEEAVLEKKFKGAFSYMNHRFPNFGYEQQMPSEQWWQHVVRKTFEGYFPGVEEDNMKVIRSISNQLYSDFSLAACWRCYDDVELCLKALKSNNIKLGVVSNFDERLELILQGLGIRSYFDVVLASAVICIAKPSSDIFKAALALSDVRCASDALHIGDDLQNDYNAAKEAGMQAALLRRDGNESKIGGIVQSLNELLSL